MDRDSPPRQLIEQLRHGGRDFTIARDDDGPFQILAELRVRMLHRSRAARRGLPDLYQGPLVGES